MVSVHARLLNKKTQSKNKWVSHCWHFSTMGVTMKNCKKGNAKGSPDIARNAFRKALELESGLSAPKTNLARLAKGETPRA